MNCNATFISVTLRHEPNLVDPKLYIYEIEKDDITTFKLKGQDRVYKHYELRKVQEVETNPLVRIPQSFDVEQHLAQARENRPGPSSSVQHRPQTRHQGTIVIRNNEEQFLIRQLNKTTNETTLKSKPNKTKHN